ADTPGRANSALRAPHDSQYALQLGKSWACPSRADNDQEETMAKGPKNVELGPKGVVPGRATYQATQVGNELLLTAKGVHPTTGFRELFEAHNLTAKVPEFAFFFIK